MKTITPEGTEELTIWDSLGIRSGNGLSLSRNLSSSPIRDKISLPPHLSSYLSASQFQLSGKLWVPKVEILAPDSWTRIFPSSYVRSFFGMGAYTTFLLRDDDPLAPIPEPVKCQRETPAIGFRAWSVVLHRKQGREYVRLQGANQGKPWPGRSMATAACTIVKDHAAPVLGCTCGLYAYHEPNGAPEYMHGGSNSPDSVMGAVVAWGRIVEYENGFRAQYARPIAISAPPHDDDLTHAFLTAALAEKTAQLLQLPFIPYENLVTYAREFGERLNQESV